MISVFDVNKIEQQYKHYISEALFLAIKHYISVSTDSFKMNCILIFVMFLKRTCSNTASFSLLSIKSSYP